MIVEIQPSHLAEAGILGGDGERGVERHGIADEDRVALTAIGQADPQRHRTIQSPALFHRWLPLDRAHVNAWALNAMLSSAEERDRAAEVRARAAVFNPQPGAIPRSGGEPPGSRC